jgi:hypothetical protein
VLQRDGGRAQAEARAEDCLISLPGCGEGEMEWLMSIM